MFVAGHGYERLFVICANPCYWCVVFIFYFPWTSLVINSFYKWSFVCWSIFCVLHVDAWSQSEHFHKRHRPGGVQGAQCKAVIFDLNNMVSPKMGFTPSMESPMADLEADDDEHPTITATTSAPTLLELPFLHDLGENNMSFVDVKPLWVFLPPKFPNNLLGTLVGYTWTSVATTPNVFHAMTSTAESDVTLGGCSILSMLPKGRLIVPKQSPSMTWANALVPSWTSFGTLAKKWRKCFTTSCQRTMSSMFATMMMPKWTS